MLMEAAMTAEQRAPAEGRSSCCLPEENLRPLPFEEAFRHFRRYVRPQLRTLSPWISESGARDLEEDIIVWLSRVCAQTLLEDFESVRPETMILNLRQGGWTRLRQKYRALDHLIEAVLTRKLDDAREFAARLEADWYALSERMGSRRGLVRRIHNSLSDPHQGMRSVKALEFDSGQRLVYKPKNIGMQAAWSQFCRWAGERIGLDLTQPRVLNRGAHGWMEFVGPEPCQNEAQVSRYYRRAGALVCLLRTLRGTECHFESLVARGEYPFLIDAETLFQPDFAVPAQPERFGRRGDNTPTLNGQAVSPAGYMEEIVTGFEQAYRMLLERKEELLAEHGPLAGFRAQPVRVALRNRSYYHDLLDRALHPSRLVDENTFRSGFDGPIPDAPTPIWEAESAALAALDIPAFFVSNTSTSLVGVEGFLRRSGYEAVKRQIEQLNEIDLPSQRTLATLCFSPRRNEQFAGPG